MFENRLLLKKMNCEKRMRKKRFKNPRAVTTE